MKVKPKTPKNRGRKGKLGLVPISANGHRKDKLGLVPISDDITHRPLSEIRPSPQNDKLYKPVDPNDPDFKALAENIRADGVREALIVTRDGYIVSGHRRYAAASIAGLETVHCRTAGDDHHDPSYLQLKRHQN